MTEEEKNLASVRAYFEAFRSGESDALGKFYHEDAVQEEFPNQFTPEGATRGVMELREAAERGRRAMASQEFEIVRAFATGPTVVVEATWKGVLAVPLGEDTPAGTVMRARFAQFYEFRDGKISFQRNYDCFYPWT